MTANVTNYEPERFVRDWPPADAPLTTWAEIEPWYRALQEREIDSPAALEAFVRDLGELDAAVEQEGTKRYVAMTCQTDDPERERAHLEWTREVEPLLKPARQALRSRYLDSPHRAALPAERYRVYDRAQANRRALFRAANVPRETEVAELRQQYQKIIGAQTVQFQGQERTPSQMAPFLEDPDRATRQAAWELVAQRRLDDRDALDDLFDRMHTLRDAIAREAGFSSFIAYAYASRERFDYGPTEVAAFRDAIAEMVVPLTRALQTQRREALSVPSLRPWDLAVDTLGRPPLRPFQEADALACGSQRIFEAVDPELGTQFAFLRDHDLLDLANRKGKAPGGYQTIFEADRLPFIFMNAVGMDQDVRTLLHEGGHAFHALAARGEPLAAYREAPIEFCEVASMTMELLGARETGVFYAPAEVERSYRQLLEGIVLILPWIAAVDAFQHDLYARAAPDRDARASSWLAVLDRFGGDVDWSGLEPARAASWHRQLHIFLYPFYYIEYGIAQLGALQLWRRSLTDRQGAVAAYRRALALGGARPLPELFAAAEIEFDFTARALEPLMRAVGAELERLAP